MYSYFGACLFSRQFLVPPDNAVDKESFPNVTIFPYGKAPFDNHTPGYYIPVFTIIEMVCYIGWIKVAESLLNPFGGMNRKMLYTHSSFHVIFTRPEILL